MKLKEILIETWALTLRDIKRAGGWKKQLLSIILGAIIIVLISIFLNYLFKADNYSSPYFIAGITATFLGLTSLSFILAMVSDKKKFLITLLVMPIYRISIFLSRIIFLFILSFKFNFILLLIAMIYYNLLGVSSLFLTILAIIFTLFIFSGIGFVILAFINKEEKVNLITYFSTIFIYLLSGVLYPIDIMPLALKYFAYINPMTYAVDFMRHAVLGNGAIPFIIDFIILLVLAIFLPLIGMCLFDKKLRSGKFY
jgi:ABC-2 type transport system permease protein